MPSDELAGRAADVLGGGMRRAVADRGRCAIALSRGATPDGLFRQLAAQNVAWEHVDVFQVDERVAPEGDPERNLTLIERDLASRCGTSRVHSMPVDEDDLEAAAGRYARELERVCGDPPALDVVHLGLGVDGHTASLLPGDPALDVTDRWVAATGSRDGHRRLTLTYPALEMARTIVFVVAGAQKAAALAGALRGDRSLPAGRLRHGHALVLADPPAARDVSGGAG